VNLCSGFWYSPWLPHTRDAITLEEQPLMGYETLVSVSASFVFGFFTPPGFGVTILGKRVFFCFDLKNYFYK
jgi:hypothetical protein